MVFLRMYIVYIIYSKLSRFKTTENHDCCQIQQPAAACNTVTDVAVENTAIRSENSVHCAVEKAAGLFSLREYK